MQELNIREGKVFQPFLKHLLVCLTLDSVNIIILIDELNDLAIKQQHK